MRLSPNQRAIAGGAILTAIAVFVLILGPALLPFQDIRQAFFEMTGIFVTQRLFEDVPDLGFFAGIPGGLFAGYYARTEDVSQRSAVPMKAGIYATLLGMFVIYLLQLAGNLVFSLVTGQTSALFSTSVIALILLAPFIPVFLAEGVIFGLVGNALRYW